MRNAIYITIIVTFAVSGCSGLQYRPQEQKPFVITDPNIAIAFEKIDAVAESVKPLTIAVEKFINTPVVDAVIPKPIKAGIGVVGASLISVAGWYLNHRKNLFKNGFNELAETDELFMAESSKENKNLQIAAMQTIKAPTRKLLKKQGFDNIGNTKVIYDTS